MKYLSRPDLERISGRVLTAYRDLPAAGEEEWRVNPDLLVRSLLGLTMKYRTLSHKGDVLGLTSFTDMELILPDSDTRGPCTLDGKTVVIERFLQESPRLAGRRNFTVAHEASHHILKLLYPRDYASGAAARTVYTYRVPTLKKRGTGGSNWEEWQMDVLSSYLLMPRELVLHNLEMALRGRKRLYRGDFNALCRTMGVSRQAMALRLEQLGQGAAPDWLTLEDEIDIFMDEEDDL